MRTTRSAACRRTSSTIPCLWKHCEFKNVWADSIRLVCWKTFIQHYRPMETMGSCREPNRLSSMYTDTSDNILCGILLDELHTAAIACDFVESLLLVCVCLTALINARSCPPRITIEARFRVTDTAGVCYKRAQGVPSPYVGRWSSSVRRSKS